MKFLIWGSTGWIGEQVVTLLEEGCHEVHRATSRLHNYQDIMAELKNVAPDRVLNLAGLTGRPNVDWCEDHQQETYFVNVGGLLNLAQACHLLDIHLTNYASGCIYTYDSDHPYGTKFKESDEPNFYGSTYSRSKILAQELLTVYPRVLTLRLRMPISSDRHPRSFLTKILGYSRVVDVPNSVTCLEELLPVSIQLSIKQVTGLLNFTNRGAISHNQILTMYREIVDPSYQWTNFTLEEQAKVLKAGRSNCELDTQLLESYYPHLESAEQAVRKVLLTLKDL